MGKLEEYIERAKDLAEDATDAAKTVAGEVRDRAKELTEENSKVRELTQSAKEQAAAISFGAREKVQGIVSDAKAVKELSIGIEELQAMPEVEGSILYTMEHESMVNNLKSLMLFINDRRLDDASVEEEIRRVMEKVKPAEMPAQEAEQAVALVADAEMEAAPAPELSEEEQAIENARIIAYSACTRAIEALRKE
jgi:hypothetical protein